MHPEGMHPEGARLPTPEGSWVGTGRAAGPATGNAPLCWAFGRLMY
jgi:hypothetical protein